MERLAMMLSQFVGDYAPKQTAAAGGVGVVSAFMFGGWTQLLLVLAVFVVMDYISGVVAASTESRLSSNKGLIGIARKVFIFAIVCVAHQVDTVLGGQHLLRDATMYFYMANEVLSITENMGRIGVPLPPKLIKAIAVLKDKGGSNDGN